MKTLYETAGPAGWCDKRKLPRGQRRWIASRLRRIRRNHGRHEARKWLSWFFNPTLLGPGGRLNDPLI